MRILLITDEVWNDETNGNNVLSNWFDGFDAEFANIYCSPGIPCTKTCTKFFQITDSMMLKSIIGKKKAGNSFVIENNITITKDFLGEQENKKLYSNLKAITTESLRALRELIWYFGKYDIQELKTFIDEFEPDIIFSPRLATIKIIRLEKLVFDLAKNVPIVAFTGDAEYTMRLFRLSPIFWIKRMILRKHFRKMMPNYSLYYTLSDEQLEEYQSEFGYKFKILRKCGNFNKEIINNTINNPIRIVYAGKLYSNRWKTLAVLGKVLRSINNDGTKIILEIYTKDKLNKHKMRLLNDSTNIFYKGAVSPNELSIIYHNSDIALHVESFDLKNRLLTRVSFSTKIIDCLESGCAVMVISWNKHSGYTYLNKEQAAFTISRKEDIYKELSKIVENPDTISEYRIKAVTCGQNNHQREVVQKRLFDDFNKVISCSKKQN